MKNLLLLILLTSLASCGSLIQDVDPGLLPKTGSQLVVHCYVSPQDTTLTAIVSTSRTSVGVQTATDQFNAVQDATVTLASGDRLVTLRYDPKQALYRADARLFPVQVGQTYTLRVATPDGRQVSASSTVPPAVPIAEVRFDSAAARFQAAGVMDYSVRLRWQDPAGSVNYYHVAGNTRYGSIDRVYQTGGNYIDTPYRAISEISFRTDGRLPYVTDQNLDGQTIESPRGRITSNQTFGGRPVMNSPVFVDVYLLNVTEAYYRYHESVRRQSQVSDNPFAEPVLIAGNIQGGFGCFGAYSRTTQTVRLN